MEISKYLHWEFYNFEIYKSSLCHILRLSISSFKSIVYQKENHKYLLIAIILFNMCTFIKTTNRLHCHIKFFYLLYTLLYLKE